MHVADPVDPVEGNKGLNKEERMKLDKHIVNGQFFDDLPAER